jgi:hypothetical protein
MSHAQARLDDEIPDEVWRILTDETPSEGADVILAAYSGVSVGEGVS